MLGRHIYQLRNKILFTFFVLGIPRKASCKAKPRCHLRKIKGLMNEGSQYAFKNLRNVAVSLLLVAGCRPSNFAENRSFESTACGPILKPSGFRDFPEGSLRPSSQYRLPGARAVLVDHDLLRRDFPELRSQSDSDIESWVVDHAAFMSAPHFAPGVKTNSAIAPRLPDESVQALRPPDYGRAALFPTDHDAFLDVKGVGVAPNSVPSNAVNGHSNGLATLAEAMREYVYEKVVHAAFRTYDNNQATTFGVYAVIDAGFNVVNGDASDRAGLIVRQAHVRNDLGGSFGTSQHTFMAIRLAQRGLSSIDNQAFHRNPYNMQGTMEGPLLGITDFGSFLGVNPTAQLKALRRDHPKQFAHAEFEPAKGLGLDDAVPLQQWGVPVDRQHPFHTEAVLDAADERAHAAYDRPLVRGHELAREISHLTQSSDILAKGRLYFDELVRPPVLRWAQSNSKIKKCLARAMPASMHDQLLPKFLIRYLSSLRQHYGADHGYVRDALLGYYFGKYEKVVTRLKAKKAGHEALIISIKNQSDGSESGYEFPVPPNSTLKRDLDDILTKITAERIP